MSTAADFNEDRGESGGSTLRFTGAQAYTDRGLTLQGGTGTVDVVTYGVLINCSGLVTGNGARNLTRFEKVLEI